MAIGDRRSAGTDVSGGSGICVASRRWVDVSTDEIFGIDTFGDITEHDGKPISPAQTIRNVVEEAVYAEEAGLDAIGIGEHHRDDFAISAPEMVLAAIASRTERLQLGTAVTVLSSDDPVRVHERFSTLDAISKGRAEIILGRGSFTESFPLFGFKLEDYEGLFEEKLQLYAELRSRAVAGEPLSWRARHTQELSDAVIYPPYEERPLPTWVAVGGSPESVVRAAHYDFPLMLAIIGGSADRFVPFADLYRRAQDEFGHEQAVIGYHSWGHVADTDEQAAAELFEPYMRNHNRIGRERGWPPATRESYLQEVQHGAMAVGSPETVAKKVAGGMKALGATRFDLKVSAGPLAHEKIMRSIELYGTKVVPLVRDMLAD
ncbi:LLM class flavin-dependent oxidoreductase [Parenemella sanctibonifatiensis]|uniref:LLM class flavin-dependent oxidoreductase n=1 Tax=Parenemella sanctibonifatiensis TaxID=2016505 RepID=A0A255E2Y2_9ACTN|nr:LLM class flavin-dependent oxidoreductase [Parenemella sanctibonifatiensis]